MLEANKSRWFEKIFSIYNKNLIKRRFNSLRVSKFENLVSRDRKIPLIIYANHSSWWDGLIAFEISQTAKLDFYIMMEERQLKNLPLFRKLGAFSVVRESPQQAVKSLRYAVKLLKNNTSRTLWIFPQGEIIPNDARPLTFFRGLEKIMTLVGECNVMPLALRYEFLGSYKPEIFVQAGDVIKLSDTKATTKPINIALLSELLTENLDKIKTDIINSDLKNYQKII